MAPSAINILEGSSFDLALRSNTIRASGSAGYPAVDGFAVGRQLIFQALQDRIEDIDQDVCEPGEEDTFFVADLGDVYRQHMRWKANLQRVRPHYGKSRPDAFLLRQITLC